jgi:hypothetical protein
MYICIYVYMYMAASKTWEIRKNECMRVHGNATSKQYLAKQETRPTAYTVTVTVTGYLF